MEFVRFEWIRTNERLEAGIWLRHFFFSRDPEIPNSQRAFENQFNCLARFRLKHAKNCRKLEQTSREHGTIGPTIDLIDEIYVNLAVQLS